MTSLTADVRPSRIAQIDPGLWPWLAVLAFAAFCLILQPSLPWLLTWPKAWVVPVAAWINSVFDLVLPVVKPVFRLVSAVLDAPMRALQTAYAWLPWPAAMAAVAAIAYRAGGWRLAGFALATLTYILYAGYWRESMNTLAMVSIAVPLAVIVGFAIGVLGHLRPNLKPGINAMLDMMQTVPAFAYLIPLLLLFGFGPVVGLLASAIYSAPPMVRNTMLGLEMVPLETRESAEMSGCTPWQRFWLSDVPVARPQLLVGLNQTTNATLSMVIIAAIIGGFSDIGWEVLQAMRKAEFGQSLLSGLVIALLAILIDRIAAGFVEASRKAPGQDTNLLAGWRLPGVILACVGLGAVFYALGGAALVLPGAEARLGISVLNQGLIAFLRDYAGSLESFKNGVLYVLMLPLRIGILGSATPAIWGFELSVLTIQLFGAGVLAAALVVAWRFGWQAAIGVAVAALFAFFGVSNMPWPAVMAMAGLYAYQAAGRNAAILTVAGLGFILLTGLWEPLTRSLYLCAAAVLICIVVGGLLGIWASANNTVSAVLRPINDALQTMPQFVFLIPALMFFRVGEFTALIAVILYAIVPPMRYFEHGLRNASPSLVEAARQMGTTPWQLLWQVKMPLAKPVIALGINQTIIAALSMLTIAALVGTRDLGQQVYIALGKADAGLGIVAGLAIAIIATCSDKVLRGTEKGRV